MTSNAPRYATPYGQASLAGLGLFQDELPSGLIFAARQFPRQNEAVFPLALRDQEHVVHKLPAQNAAQWSRVRNESHMSRTRTAARSILAM